jgi:hypothetical protein
MTCPEGGMGARLARDVEEYVCVGGLLPFLHLRRFERRQDLLQEYHLNLHSDVERDPQFPHLYQVITVEY